MSSERVQYRNITLLLFAPSQLSLYAQPGDSGSKAVPHSPDEALRNSGGEAVLDGPMFEKCDPTASYASQTCGTVLYKHLDTSGVNFASRYPTRGMTISVMPDGSTHVASGDTAAPGARVAVQLYPRLVVGGAPQTVADQTFNYVTALGVMRDGRMAFVVGRNLSLPNFAQQLADAGVTYAGYTDGGDSAALAAVSGYVGSSEHRRVLTWLVAKPAPTFSSAVLPALAVAAVVAGVITLLIRNTKHTPGYNRSTFNRPRHNPELPGGLRFVDLTTIVGKKRRDVEWDGPEGKYLLWIRSDGYVYLDLYPWVLKGRAGRISGDVQDVYRFEQRNGSLDPTSGVLVAGEEPFEKAPFGIYVIADEMFREARG